MTDTVFKSQIAEHLKACRKERKLSLDATSKLTGVSKAMLGQIEREESSPTIATLWKISAGLGISFSAFFANQPELQSSERVFPDDAKMKVKTLFPFKPDSGMEMFEISLIDKHKQMSTAHSVGVIEHIHVLEGELNLFFDNEWHALKVGDSVRFFADQPHGYEGLSDKTVFQDVICYPS